MLKVMQAVSLSKSQISQFQNLIQSWYIVHGRHDLPWRLPEQSGGFDPYKITVSEIMLQQTQVSRVIPKYLEFLKVYPTVQALAAAPLADVLRIWSGLGYNRRAKFLHQTAQTLCAAFKGEFPTEPEQLVMLPGVGKNTAAAIAAYSFNKPVIFIETNIRTVYLHHFFQDKIAVADTDILALVAATQNTNNPRQWYWALMDYGSFLKSSQGNANTRSKHYVKQSNFQGSRRQVRGAVLKLLIKQPLSLQQLQAQAYDERLETVLTELQQEGLITIKDHAYHLGK